MKEDHICYDSRHCRFSRPRSEAIQSGKPSASANSVSITFEMHLHASSHETAICVRLRSPDTAAKADNRRNDEDRPSTEACLDRNPGRKSCQHNIINCHFGIINNLPDEVTETENQNCNTGKLHHICEAVVESRDVLGKHGSLDACVRIWVFFRRGMMYEPMPKVPSPVRTKPTSHKRSPKLST